MLCFVIPGVGRARHNGESPGDGDAAYVDLAVGSRLSPKVQAVGPCSTSPRLFHPFTFISNPGEPGILYVAVLGLTLSIGFCLTDLWPTNIIKLYYLNFYF